MSSPTTAILCLALQWVLVTPSDKVWLGNRAWENPDNWQSSGVPTGADQAIIKSDVLSLTSKNIFIGEISFQSERTLLLLGPHEAELGFQSAPLSGTKKSVVFHDNSSASWLDPELWKPSQPSALMPDSMKVPCPYDSVELGTKRNSMATEPAFKVSIENIPVNVKTLQIGGVTLSGREFQDFKATAAGRAMVQDGYYGISIQGSSCLSEDDCLCGNDRTEILSLICAKRDLCPTITCYDPLRAAGDCCDFCGALLTVDPLPSLSLATLRTLLSVHVDGSTFHSYVWQGFDSRFHVKIADKERQPERAHEAARVLQQVLLDRSYVTQLQRSGSTRPDRADGRKPLSDGVLAVIILLFIGTAAVLALIFQRSRRFGGGMPAFRDGAVDLSADVIRGLQALPVYLHRWRGPRLHHTSRMNLVDEELHPHIEILENEILGRQGLEMLPDPPAPPIVTIDAEIERDPSTNTSSPAKDNLMKELKELVLLKDIPTTPSVEEHHEDFEQLFGPIANREKVKRQHTEVEDLDVTTPDDQGSENTGANKRSDNTTEDNRETEKTDADKGSEGTGGVGKNQESVEAQPAQEAAAHELVNLG